MTISITFDPVLYFFLADHHKGGDLVYPLTRRTSVKDIIESLGVPHTEVGGICFNEQMIDFSFIPETAGDLHVQGMGVPFDVRTPSLLRPEPLERYRFIADVNVLKLGRRLILLGFDVACSSSFSDEQIADLSATESRIVLTRDTTLLKRKKIVFARRIRSNLPDDQLLEVMAFFELWNQTAFFSRCTRCNRSLAPVSKIDIMQQLEPKTRKYFFEFLQCPNCLKIFWKGSHYDAMTDHFSSLGIFPKTE